MNLPLCCLSPCPSWFHGKITREQAERLLYPPETGLFLVRESTNYPGDYTLCVSCEGKVEHYRIIYSSSKLSIDEEVYFENLMQLVEVSCGGEAPQKLGQVSQSSLKMAHGLGLPAPAPCSHRPKLPALQH